MEENNQTPKIENTSSGKSWFDKYYKLLMIIPILIVVILLGYLFYFYNQNNDVVFRDVSLSGGTVITLRGDIDFDNLELQLKLQFNSLSFKKLTDIRTGKTLAFIIESSSGPDELKKAIEEIIKIPLTSENSSIEFSGESLGKGFYKQLAMALLISFILMSIVVLFLFKTLVPSLAIIFAALSDIIMPLAIIDMMGMRLSAAGIAAFLMLIGYSVDTDILLTTRAVKNRTDDVLNNRILRAFKTGIFMTITALCAVLPAFLLITALPDSFRQIFLILALGLGADIINTWLTNVGIIKWYCEKKGIN